WTVDQDQWDITGTGHDVPSTEIYGPGDPLDRGLTSGERSMRSRMPDAILVANGTRTVHAGLLDGLAWESFADPLVHRDPVSDLTGYVTVGASEPHRKPGVSMTISSRRVRAGSADDYRRARFALAATLMQNGFWAPMGDDYGQPAYYDEMDGAGLGRGYLGEALEPNPPLSVIPRSPTTAPEAPPLTFTGGTSSTASPWSTSALRPSRSRSGARTDTCLARPTGW